MQCISTLVILLKLASQAGQKQNTKWGKYFRRIVFIPSVMFPKQEHFFCSGDLTLFNAYFSFNLSPICSFCPNVKCNFSLQIVKQVLGISKMKYFFIYLLWCWCLVVMITLAREASCFRPSSSSVLVSPTLFPWDPVQQRLMPLATHSCERLWSPHCLMSAAQFGGLMTGRSGNLLHAAAKSDLWWLELIP